MMTLLLAFSAAAMFQQQPVSSPRPASASGQVIGRSNAAVSNVDSTVSTVAEVGVKVGEMRSAYNVYRLAVFNQADGMVVQRAAQLGASCRTLITTVEQGARVLCRSCLGTRAMQAAMDQYRAVLPTVRTMAQRCADRMKDVHPERVTPAQTSALRRDVRTIGAQLTQGLRAYEDKLRVLRHAMGWDGSSAPPPGRSR